MRWIGALCLCLAAPVHAAVDGCLLGTWVLPNPDITQVLKNRVGSVDLKKANLFAVATVGPDGALTGTISDGEGVFVQSGATFEAFVSGRFDLVISTQNGQLHSEIINAKTKGRIELSVPNAQNPVLQEINAGMEAITERVHVHKYTCTRDRVELENLSGSSSPFDVWVRQKR